MNEKMKNRKSLYMLLAFLVAISVWIYVDEFGNNGGPKETETTITDIPIIYVGEESLADRGLMLLEEETTTTLDLTISGGRRRVASLDRDDIRVTVNLNGVDSAGLQNVNYVISSTNKKFSQDMIVSKNPSIATVNIKELNSKTVEIRCELVGNLADGYSAGELVMSQQTVELRGQAEDIDPISYAKVTLDIGTLATETVTQQLTFSYYDANDQFISSTNIHPTVEAVQVTLPVFVTKELQLVVDFKEAPGVRAGNLDYEIKPSTIVVSGDASVLNGLDTITVGEFDLLDLLGSGASSHTYPIIIPDGCQNLSGVTRATLEIGFKDMAKTQVATDRFPYTNLPNGKHVDILTKELNVTIFGTTEDVAAVTGEHLSVEVNLSNYAAASGTYTVPATVAVNAPGDIGVTGTYQVQVTIREQNSAQPETGAEAGTSEETE